MAVTERKRTNWVKAYTNFPREANQVLKCLRKGSELAGTQMCSEAASRIAIHQKIQKEISLTFHSRFALRWKTEEV